MAPPPLRKRFGQHFLVDEAVIDRIFRALDLAEDDRVVEIGPGRGALTSGLLAHAGGVTAIEIDRDLAGRLAARFPELDLVIADALRVDFAELLARMPPRRRTRLVGNLPYNVATPLLGRLFPLRAVTDMHVMLQREVGDRLAAVPGTGTYGRLTVLAQYHCMVDKLFDVVPASFRPHPKVHSTFIRLAPRAERMPCDVGILAEVVRRAFSQRRKMLGNALASLEPDWEALGLEPRRRAEELDVASYVALARHVAAQGDGASGA